MLRPSPLRGLRLLSLATLATALTACLFREDGDESPGGPSILPLAVGNTWSYVDSTYYFPDSSLATPDSVVVGTSRSGIIGTRRVTLGDGRRTVHLASALDPATGEPFGLVTRLRDRADGNHTAGIEQGDDAFTVEVLHVKYPAVTGERYPTYFPSFRNENGARVPVLDTVEIEVADARDTCVVPAGTFACVRYRGWRPDGTPHATGFYAPGVGFLGSETVRTETAGDSTRVVVRVRRLASYTLF